MSRVRLPLDRVRGEHVLILGKLLQHLGAPFPVFFQELRAEDSVAVIGVAVTGIPMNPAYYREYVEEWRTTEDVLPLQLVAHRAIHALRSHFSDQLRGSQFGGIPPIVPDGLGEQYGPLPITSYPYPPPSSALVALRGDTTDTVLIAETMLFHATRGALSRAEESSEFWQQQFRALQTLQATHQPPTPDDPTYHPTYPTTTGVSYPTVPASDPPPVPPPVPPPATSAPYSVDDPIPVFPAAPIPGSVYGSLYTAVSPLYSDTLVSFPPSLGDLGEASAPIPDYPLPPRMRPEYHSHRMSVHPGPARDSALVGDLFRAFFGDPSASRVAGGVSPSRTVEDEEESDPSEAL